MPPKVSPNKPLGERLLPLVKNTQFFWFLGQFAVVLFSTIYTLQVVPFRQGSSCIFRTGIAGAVLAYSIVLYKVYGSSILSRSSWNTPFVRRIMTDDNVLYFGLALSLFMNRPVLFALTPYAIYATFHISTYMRSNLLPAVSPSVTSGTEPKNYFYKFSQLLNKYTRTQFQPAMKLVANIEAFLFFRYFFGFFLRLNTFSQFIFYAFFLRMRYNSSHFTRASFREIGLRMDRAVADHRVPPQARNAWAQTKHFLSRFGNVPVAQSPTSSARPTSAST
ncbi:tetra spanning protein 1, Tts1 [Schizosaccharomyces osmophilus]|uniref:Tetra spanning protein 1, Tts1 n=1 Tax=Schizosaccharomyces osmophilus TaxID=2545709 RepID=A0AAF0AX22_9SCHI|nr:tetra spanning protein 1, Tts1 [Schizosaccharomyces osmophilus]WBW73863.1 tetra spanning protein 1, Tts1 [Schizosaccharomyces osmophilus]